MHKVINKNCSGASVVTNALEVKTVLVVNSPPAQFLTPLQGFGIAWEVSNDNRCGDRA